MSDNKTYGTRGRAAPLNHRVYTLYLEQMGIGSEHHAQLKKRGLNSENIQKAQYGTKRTNNTNDSRVAIAAVVAEFGDQLKGIPGFYRDKDGHWTHQGISGVVIPVRDIDGNIDHLIVKNDNPTKNKEGRITNKYLTFSSAKFTDGAKSWQTTHCPLIKGNAKEYCGTTICITEGVLKADVATAIDPNGAYYVGLQGLKIHGDLKVIVEDLEGSIAEIYLDAGEDDKADMIRSKCQLIIELRHMGIDVVVKTWDKKYGKGIDDVLLAGNKDKIKSLTDLEVERLLEKGNSADPENGDWLYVIETERFVNIRNYRELKKTQFVDRFSLVETRAASILIGNGVMRVDGLIYEPAKEQIIEDDKENVSYLNTWRDPEIVAREGDCSLLIDHLNFLFNEDQRSVNIMLDWMAFQIQNPGIKILWALVIIGDEGIGKSFFSMAMEKILGEWNVSVPSNEEVHEIYTGWLKNCMLVIIEEIMSRGRLAFMNKLKPIITQPFVKIREMHTKTYKQPNRTNMLMFSNHEDSLLIDEGDRRYCFLKSDVIKKEIGYYGKLFDWLRDKDTPGKIVWLLKDRDISLFNPNDAAPLTDAKKDIISIVRSPLDTWVAQGIEDEAWPFAGDLISVRHLKEISPNEFKILSDYKWAQALKAAGAVKIDKQIKISDGSKVWLWAVRRSEMYAGADMGVLIKKYESGSLNVEPGGNPLQDIKPL